MCLWPEPCSAAEKMDQSEIGQVDPGIRNAASLSASHGRGFKQVRCSELTQANLLQPCTVVTHANC